MAATIKATTDPYYTPGKYQRDPFFNWTGTEVIGGPSGYYEQNPQSYFDRYVNERQGVGLGDTSNYAQFVRQQYNTAQRGFQSAIAEDPTLTFRKYLDALNANYRQMFDRLTPQQRGENPTRYAGPIRIIRDL